MAVNDSLDALRDVWAARMPITGALRVVVTGATSTELRLAMPLAPNRNHKGTMFAGSLAALATLAGWSVLWLIMLEADPEAHIVIQDSSIRYLHPARSDATAHAAFPDQVERERLLATFRRRGRARIALEVQVRDDSGETVTTFRGRYVVHK